jgi:hypothetical protein
VVQISKIQVRRGQKNSNTGVPQLSSAEFAWAVDTQELYIGNGSVAEGAPEVGNTKILTENDNLIELASSYEFANDDPSITTTQARSLQEKIDEIQVSVLDFGAVPDGSTDNTQAFQNAFTALFRNIDESYRKILLVPNGEYLFTQNLQIPSGAIIRGETDKAILNIQGNTVSFITADGKTSEEFTSSNVPKNIEISNIKVSRTTGTFDVTGLYDSKFTDVIIEGEYQLTDTIVNISSESPAITWTNDIIGTRVDELVFRDCTFIANSLSFNISQNNVFETRVNFENCSWNQNHTGLILNGSVGQTNRWNFNRCSFNEIFASGLVFNTGIGTKLTRCSFINCGNGTSNADSPETAQVIFGESTDNVAIDCDSNRFKNAGVIDSDQSLYITEIQGSSKTSLATAVTADVFLSDSAITFAAVGAQNQFTEIDYTLRLGTEIRRGSLILTLDDTRTKVSLSDAYDYSDNSLSSSDGLIMSAFEFEAELKDNNADTVNDTVVLKYRNPNLTGATGNISFNVSYGV